MGKFIIKKRTNGEFMFNLLAANYQIILTSQGYVSKAGCENGIASVRINSELDERFKRLTSSNGKPYFNLVAANGEIIGTSEMYESTAARDNGIASVKSNAPQATVEDRT